MAEYDPIDTTPLNEPGNCPRHQETIETPKDEVRGPVARFTVQHTYKGVYPDGCKPPRSYRYWLHVDGQYIASAENTQTGLWSVLKSIAERLNAQAEVRKQIAQELRRRNIEGHGEGCLCLVCAAFESAARIIEEDDRG